MSNDMSKLRHLTLSNSFNAGGFHIELFSDNTFLTLSLLENPMIHLRHPISKASSFLSLSFLRLQVSHPYITIGNMMALHNLIFKCLHLFLNQIFCFNITKAYKADEIWYSISVWIFVTILPRYLNICACSIGRSSTSILRLHSAKSLILPPFIFRPHFWVASTSSLVDFLSLPNT